MFIIYVSHYYVSHYAIISIANRTGLLETIIEYIEHAYTNSVFSLNVTKVYHLVFQLTAV